MNTEGWDYVVALKKEVYIVANLDKPLQAAPTWLDIHEVLKAAQLQPGKPAPDYEWAINFNNVNDFNSNFSSQVLRDRAIDEHVLNGLVEDGVSICSFEIYADGEQVNDRFDALEEWLERSKALMNLTLPQQRLRMAILDDDDDMLRDALKEGADPNKIHPPLGLNPLHMASKLGHTWLVGMLHEDGANLEVSSDSGDTALHFAARHQREEACRKLLALGASVEARNGQGLSPLDVATTPNGSLTQDLLRIMVARAEAMRALKSMSDMRPGEWK